MSITSTVVSSVTITCISNANVPTQQNTGENPSEFYLPVPYSVKFTIMKTFTIILLLVLILVHAGYLHNPPNSDNMT